MMVIREYNKRYYDLMCQWIAAREVLTPAEHTMPETGWIAFYADTPVAMQFLRRVEGNFCMLDGLVTNPDVAGPIRSQAIDLITESGLIFAKAAGFTSVFGWSKDNNTLMRAARFGFTVPEETFLYKNLKD